MDKAEAPTTLRTFIYISYCIFCLQGKTVFIIKDVVIASHSRASHKYDISGPLNIINQLWQILRMTLASTTTETHYGPCLMAWRCGSLCLNSSLHSLLEHLGCQGSELAYEEALALFCSTHN